MAAEQQHHPAVAVCYEGLASPSALRALRTLNAALFPVKFHDRCYEDALACGDVSQLAYVDGALVGAIMCRLEAQPGGARLYIISLGVLAPYRCLGIASRLLELSLSECADDPAITTAALHVHTGDEEAQAWYLRRGFKVAGTVKDYYRRLDPPDALLLERRLVPLEAAGDSGGVG